MMNQEQVEKLQSFARTFERHFDLGFNFEIEKEDVELIQAVVVEVERLQKRLAQTEKCYEIMEKATFKASDKMSSFKKALEFYACENNHFRVDMYAESMVMQDAGKIARQALGGEAHE